MKFDVLILGGGPGGYETAIRCSQYNLKTALVEAEALGGTCLNKGCIPTKALVHSADVFRKTKESAASGVTAAEIAYDYPAIARRKDMIVKRLTGGVAYLEQAYGVTVINGFGVLTGQHTVLVNGETIEAENIILATGSVPASLPIKGIDSPKVINSDGVLNLQTLPESMAIIGGGVIGLEFAAFMSNLGVKVTILEVLGELLPLLDRDIVKVLLNKLKKSKVDIFTGIKISEIVDHEDSVSVLFEDAGGESREVSSSLCAVCAGRKPASSGIGLEAAGVRTNLRGYVDVDDQMRTNIPGIYAIGDVTGKIQLAHVASHQGMVAAAGCAGKAETMEYEAVPACIYSIPEIAYIGKGTAELEKEAIPYKVGTFSASSNGRALTLGETDGMVKIFAEKESGKVLGAQMAGNGVCELIAEISVLMHFNGTLDDLAKSIHPHPSLSEMISEAALQADGLSCNSVPIR